jgi:hypothetical protein
MVPIILAAFVAIEQRRQDFEGQRRRYKQWVAFEFGEDHSAKPTRGRVAFRPADCPSLAPTVTDGDAPVDQSAAYFCGIRRAEEY